VNHGIIMGVICLAIAAWLCACATPAELERPIGRPAMGAVNEPDPLPAYVSPQPESVADQP